jgi:type II secretory ATPase GspE/PulE/Tfp pilus assembly ATPase PilB-like protein
VIFGMFGGKKGGDSGKPGGRSPAGDSGENEEDDDDRDLISFQGATNGKTVDLAAHSRLTQAGLVPAKKLVTDALERRAESVKVEVKGERAQVTLYVDGVAYSGGKLAKPMAVAISQVMKLLAGLDPKLKGQAQQGGVKGEFNDLPWEISVETTPQPDGSEKLMLRTRNTKLKLNSLDELNYASWVKTTIRELASGRRGVVLVGGSSGSGVTTLTYALVRGIDLYMYSVFTIVQMGSREIYNVTKFEANEGDDLQQTMERMMRAEADVIFIDPIRSPDVAKAAAKCSDRVSIIGEAAGKDAASAIVQFSEYLGDPALASQVLKAALSQKMIRTLCPSCKEAFRPNPKLLAKVGLPPETKVLYRKPEPEPDPKTGELPPPCEKCDGIGYFGRIAMVEVIANNESIQKLIASGATPDQIKAQARAEGQATLHREGLRLVAEGKTSLEELQRIFKA